MQNKPHILIVDDDAEIRDLLSKVLAKHELRITTARDGKDMDGVLSRSAIDLIVLDIMMPREDGLAITRRLRADNCQIPILMLTAIGEDVDRILGLEMGADDYLPKPFNPRELVARIKSILRRTNQNNNNANNVSDVGMDEVLVFGDFEINPRLRKLSKGKEVIALSGGEYDLLWVFVTHPQRVLSRDQLLDLAKGRDAAPFDRAIDIQVSRLRRKLDDDSTLITTVRGGGYMFTGKVEKKEVPA